MTLFQAKLKYIRAQFDARGMTAQLPPERLMLAFSTLLEPDVSFNEWVASCGIPIEDKPPAEEEFAEQPLAAESPQPDPSATSAGGLVRVPVKIDEAAEKAKDALDDKLTEAQKAAHNDSWVDELKRAADAKRLPEAVKLG